MMVCAPARGAEVYLSWKRPATNTDGTPLTDLAGYRIHCGLQSGTYTLVDSVGVQTNYTFTGLAEGVYHYFAVTAVDVDGHASEPSMELKWSSRDHDGDTLPDAWEHDYFGDLAAAPTHDSDADGVDNMGEYLAGTDPTDTTDVLAAQEVYSSAPGSLTMTWPVVSGRTYRVTCSEANRLRDWSPVFGPVAVATNGHMSWTATALATAPMRAYRIELVMP
jgi:hypothetical protein